MEIRVERAGPGGGTETHQVAVTMRTPGHDYELAAGFLFSEGLVRDWREIHSLTHCTGPDAQEYNVVSVRLRPGASFDPAFLTRNFYTTSSCGVCGKASLDAVEIQGCRSIPRDVGPVLAASMLKGLPDQLRARQELFRRTGGIHAAGVADPTGTFAVVREDVGRHNAVDKAVGHLLLERSLPANDRLLVVSGRTSFEILQKALMAGVPMVAAVGAPSSLAVEVARRFGMTLVGFLGEGGFNVYSGEWRVREDV